MKILVADDSKTNIALITDSLQRLGHEVVAVDNGESVINQFIHHHPDLIILDVDMNGMDGFECAQRIRKIESEGKEKNDLAISDWIPIIFLSATVDDASIAAGINAGGDDYLAKPFSDITLEAKIKAMQRIAEMRRKLYDTTQELRILSSIDTLTGAYNRFQFEKSLKEKLVEADRHNLNLALLFIDLDHFKAINDTMSHHIGDLVLCEVVKRIKSCIRYEDFLARIGGDEFVVVLGFMKDPVSAGDVARAIITALTPEFYLNGYTARISCSIGIACYPSEGVTHQSLLQCADIAMYHAKDTGRNKFQFYINQMNEKYRQQMCLEHDLKFALAQHELSIVYQPIYNLVSKNIYSIETLLRWEHKEYGVISPNVFIPIAEESGFINQIGMFVLRQACNQASQWIGHGLNGFKISVNLSLQELLQDNFVQELRNILNDTALHGRMLELELTECAIITYTPHLKKVIEKLHDMGISVIIDDFGTRNSSLKTLSNLQISSFKINRHFMNELVDDSKNSIIVKTLISLGNNLNLKVIAEGVESEKQLEFLIVNGCQFGQGFHLSEPQSVSEMSYILAQSNKVK